MASRPTGDFQRPRILIVRLSAVGDVVHGLPVLCALRDKFPEASLAWVVESRASALLEGHKDLDELIVAERGWLKSPRAILKLRRQLREFSPDVTIDLQGLSKSAVMARLSGCKKRIGFAGDNGRELSRWMNTELVETTAGHVIDINLELLKPLRINAPQVRFDVPEDHADTDMVEALLRQSGTLEGFAIINPGAGWPSKLWPTERYANVAGYLGREHGLPTMVVWAGRQEWQWAEQIVDGSNGHARLAPSTTLQQLAALTRRARLFIGSDTGPLHIAAAVGTTCVGLYGPMPSERNGPYGPRHVALQKVKFEGTSRERRNASKDLMEAIRVDHVCAACDSILKKDSFEVA